MTIKYITGADTVSIFYSLVVRYQSKFSIDAVQEVPVPASLALMSLGLMGLSFTQRRKAKSI
jgi:hypothetical protein